MTTTRRRPGRPPVPRERILQTALEIIDEEGPGALSLRALAERLSSSTATLYRHVSGRAELVTLVVDRMIGEADLRESDLAELAWDEACRRVATALYETLSRHGNAARLLVDVMPAGPNGMAVRELLIGTMLRAGFSPEVTARAVTTIMRYVLGFAMQTQVRAPDDASPGDAPADVPDPEAFPMVSAVAHLLPQALPDEFAFGLDLLLTALGTHLPGAAAT